MGRPVKNPRNTVARLREKLSNKDSNKEWTRKRLAKEAGIPWLSLRQIELGKYGLSSENAERIAYATGADPESLLRGDDPLLDLAGQELNPKSPDLLHHIWTWQKTETLTTLLHSILTAANDNLGLAVKVGLSFAQWSSRVSNTFGLDKAIFKELKWKTKPGFDPLLIPRRLWKDQIKRLPIADQIRINAAFLPRAAPTTITRSSEKKSRSRQKKAA